MQEKNEKITYPSVIVRAWGDEPVKMQLHSIENNRCYVLNKPLGRRLGLPFDQVISYEESLFCSLRKAYESGSMDKLKYIYDNIPLDDFACNKYRDKVQSCHDKEQIRDSRQTA